MSHAQQAPPPPPLSLAGGPPQQGPSVLQILQMGQERNHAADALAHHPRIESLIKLGKESEATWLQIGQTAEALGDFDRAIVAYESALRHNAYSVVALSQIAAICRSKDEFRKAAEYFGRVVGIAPDSGDVWGALGHCFLMIDDLKKAYSSYQQALYYMPNPQEPKLWYGIGILYDRYGSLEHAEEAFSSVIRMDPDFEKANEIFFRLGIIYKQQRKSAQSLECFRYILNNPPRPLTEIDIWFQIGHVYEQQKDFIAAKESYERVLAENPAHAKVLQQLGGLYHRSRAPFYNPEVSVQILTKSLESDANDPFSWYLLGRAYMTTSNFGKAYEAYQQAVYRDGKNPAFWCSIGVLYYNINQFHDALDAYSRAIRIHPYLAEVWFNLGALYESCNDQMSDAIDAYQRTLQLDPSNTVVSTRLREIREHQTNGTPLSTPPQPKDISPSSLNWNYATNAGGGPATLAQAGLGPDMSPALSRNGGAGSAGSPVNGHHFDGPPSSNGARPRSTDPGYRAPPPHEERRRTSRSLGQPGHEQSPHPTHRTSNSSQSAQMKPMQEQSHHGPASSRASPTFAATAAASDAHKHRGSPISPRSRSRTDQHPAYAQHPAHHVHHGGPLPPPPPPPHAYAYNRAGEIAGPHAPPPPGDVSWRHANGGRESAQSHRSHHASPPGSSHGPPQPQPPVPYGSHHYHQQQQPMYADRNYAEERGTVPPIGARPPPGYPTPYGYAPYVQASPPVIPQQATAPLAHARYEASSSRDEHGPASAGRRSSGEKSPKAPAAASAQPANGKSTAESGKSGKDKDAAITANGKSSPTKTKKDKDESSTATPTGGRKGETKASSKRKNDSPAGGAAKKERRTSAAKKDKEGAASSTASAATKKLNAAAKLLSAAAAASASVAEESSGQSTPVRPAAPVSSMPSREVDEDYDEGVDALMGLAASASRPPVVSASEQSVPSPPPPPPRSATGAAVPEKSASPAASNPRKRSLDSTEHGDARDMSVQAKAGSDEQDVKRVKGDEVDATVKSTNAVVSEKERDETVEEEEGEVKETPAPTKA